MGATAAQTSAHDMMPIMPVEVLADVEPVLEVLLDEVELELDELLEEVELDELLEEVELVLPDVVAPVVIAPVVAPVAPGPAVVPVPVVTEVVVAPPPPPDPESSPQAARRRRGVAAIKQEIFMAALGYVEQGGHSPGAKLLAAGPDGVSRSCCTRAW